METKNTPEIPLLSSQELYQRKFWYSKTFILFNILEHSRGREMTFLYNLNRKHNVRYLNAGSLNIIMEYLGLQTNDEKQKGEDSKNPFSFLSTRKNLNVFCSLATIDWENCPIKAFSYAVGERVRQQKEFKANIKKYIIDFEGAIDFDGDVDYVIKDGKEVKIELDCTAEESVTRSLEDLKAVIGVFNEYKIKWRVHFSGSRGFHIFWEVPMNVTPYQKRLIINDMVRLFYEVFELKTVDRSSYNSRKVMKCSYSVVTKKGVTRVVLPLSKEDIDNFKLSQVECNYVYYNVKGLKNRGLLWNNANFNKSESISNFMKFMDDYELTIPKHIVEDDE